VRRVAQDNAFAAHQGLSLAHFIAAVGDRGMHAAGPTPVANLAQPFGVDRQAEALAFVRSKRGRDLPSEWKACLNSRATWCALSALSETKDTVRGQEFQTPFFWPMSQLCSAPEACRAALGVGSGPLNQRGRRRDGLLAGSLRVNPYIQGAFACLSCWRKAVAPAVLGSWSLEQEEARPLRGCWAKYTD